MRINKRLGIWMDHSTAHLIEFTTNPPDTISIGAKFVHQDKKEPGGSSENLKHNKEQHEQLEFYKKLGESIKNYDEVILFGPTQAKTELFNILMDDRHFAGMNIKVKPADQMTDHQQHAFVKSYFLKIK